MRSSLVLLTAIASCALHPLHATAQSWTQTGADIDGDTINGLSGYSVSMPDPYTVGVGSYDDQNTFITGKARIFAWSGVGNAWVQKGPDIHGASPGDGTARSLSMPDANTIAIGAPSSDGNGPDAGRVRVYDWTGTDWVQRGADIHGEASGDGSGAAVSMPDPNTVAIGAPMNDGGGLNAGHVRLWTWSGTLWLPKGADIDGVADGDGLGSSVSMPDANTVATGAPYNSGNGNASGHARVHAWDGNAWVQKGLDLDGTTAEDRAGYAVSMPDANTIALASPWNNVTGFQIGYVRIFSWNGSAWVQQGGNINGEADDDRFGSALSMPDASTVGIGSLWNDGGATDAGHARIHEWNGSAWVQVGADINGEAADDNSAVSLSMPDAHTIAIGAPLNDGYATNAGHVRIYGDGTVSVQENDQHRSVVAYPNPFHDQVTIELGVFRSSMEVIARNVLGQEVIRETQASTDRAVLRIPGPPGVYAVELRTNDGRIAVVNVVKEL